MRSSGKVWRDLMVSGKVWEGLDCVQLSVVRDLVVTGKVYGES